MMCIISKNWFPVEVRRTLQRTHLVLDGLTTVEGSPKCGKWYPKVWLQRSGCWILNSQFIVKRRLLLGLKPAHVSCVTVLYWYFFFRELQRLSRPWFNLLLLPKKFSIDPSKICIGHQHWLWVAVDNWSSVSDAVVSWSRFVWFNIYTTRADL